MIPIRDHNPSGRFPFVTYLLIGINILVFLYMFALPETSLEGFISSYAFVPAYLGNNPFSLLSSMFLHGGLGHIAGNMLFLNIFGDNLEDKLGHFRFFFFYLICGLGASFLQLSTDLTSTIPSLGASGAIAGVMGGYLVLFPKQQIDVLFSFGLSLRKMTVPAFTMLAYWFIAQLFSGVGTLGMESMGGVAYFAHIGGFTSGWILISLFRAITKRKRLF